MGAGVTTGAVTTGAVRRSVRDVSATPPTSSAAAHHRSGLTGSPRNRNAGDMPKTGTRRENGATVVAGWWRSRKPHAPALWRTGATRRPAIAETVRVLGELWPEVAAHPPR